MNVRQVRFFFLLLLSLMLQHESCVCFSSLMFFFFPGTKGKQMCERRMGVGIGGMENGHGRVGIWREEKCMRGLGVCYSYTSASESVSVD